MMSQGALEKSLLALATRTQALFACRLVPPLYQEACASLCQLADTEQSYFFVEAAAPGGPLLAHAYAPGNLPTPQADPRVLALARSIWAERALVVVNDGQAITGRMPRSEGRLRRAVALPLHIDKQWLGALVAVGRAEPATPPPLPVMTLLAEQVSLALDNARMFARANHDPVTGLPNHSYLLFHLAKMQQDVTIAAPGGLMVVDLDAFARVNEAGGTQVGDRALHDVAQTLAETLQEDALVCRLGSDKFAVLMPPDAKLGIGLRLRDAAERVRAAVGAKTYAKVRMSASVGAVTFTPSAAAQPAQDLLAAADDCLAQARRLGPGGIIIA